MNGVAFGININRITSTSQEMPVDPVCGIEMEQELAIILSHKNKTYYFCCDGCKSIFTRKPHKYSK
jgi:YHS domain-containing protein